MDLDHAIEPVTTLKARSAELIRRARESRRPIVITQNGRATAVLQDVESFERQRRALAMLKLVATGDQEVRDGRSIPHAGVMRRIERKIAERRRNG